MTPTDIMKPFASLACKEGGSGKVVSLRHVPPHLDFDTIECLEALLREARAGRIIGLAFAALRPGHAYIAHTCGEVHRNRVLARGILRELDDDLSAPGR